MKIDAISYAQAHGFVPGLLSAYAKELFAPPEHLVKPIKNTHELDAQILEIIRRR